MCTRWWRGAFVAGLLGVIEPSSSHGDLPDPSPFHDPPGMYPPCFEDEVAALLAIKAELNDPNDVLGDWLVDADGCSPCRWTAVVCITGDFHVTHLYLSRLGLSGTLSPRIADLTSLQILTVLLEGNTISGPVPDSIGSLGMLEVLDMGNNRVTGTIQSSLGDLKNLYTLALQDNAIFGRIPDSIGSIQMLAELDMSNNSLNGSIPSSLGDLKNLQFLKLNDNSLSGVVPDSLGTIDSLFLICSNSVIGNPLICGVNSGDNCSGDQNAWSHHFQRGAVICAAAVGSVVLVTVVGMLLWWRYKRTQKILPVAT